VEGDTGRLTGFGLKSIKAKYQPKGQPILDGPNKATTPRPVTEVAIGYAPNLLPFRHISGDA
jgi:hypothetical protein